MARYFDPAETSIQLKKVCEEMGTSLSRVQEDAQTVKEWVKMQPHLPDPHPEDGLLYENMLLRCKCSIEVTKQAIDFYCSQRAAVPEFFVDRDPTGEAIKSVPSYITTAVLKDPTSQGYKVTIFKMTPNSELFNFAEMINSWLLDADIRLQAEVSVSDIYLNDAAHFGMSHVIKISATAMHKAIVCGLNGYKVRVKGVHVINMTQNAEIILNMLKRLMPAKIRSRVHVHSTLESLHQHIDKKILPKEYGGDKASLATLSEEWVEEVRSRRAWVLAMDGRCQVDESKRPGKTFNVSEIFGVEGSFKQLAVD